MSLIGFFIIAVEFYAIYAVYFKVHSLKNVFYSLTHFS